MSDGEAATAAAVAHRLASAGVTMGYGAERGAGGAAQHYAAEAEDPLCLTPDQIDGLLDGAAWRRVVAMGDSTIEGLGDPVPGYQTHSFVERLVAALRRQQRNLRFRNLAERDLTVGQVRDSQLEAAVAFRPKLAVFSAGGNDMFPPEWEPDSVERDLDTIVGSLRGAGADVVTCTYMNPVNAIPMFKGTPLDERLPELNRRIRAVAGRHGAILVDHADSAASYDVSVYSHDIKHLTMRGHGIVVGDFAKALFRHLQPDAAAHLQQVEATASRPAVSREATMPTNPLVYGGAMDAARLKAIPLFADLPPATLERIALYAGERGVPAGEPIITQGDYSHEMSCIESGTVDVIQDGERISQLGPGAVIGEVGLLRRTRRTATVVATSDVRIITLTSWDLTRLPDRVVDSLTALMEERLRANAEREAVVSR